MSFLRLLFDAWRPWRFACLLASLFLTLGAVPLLGALGRDPAPLTALLGLNLVAAVLGAVAERGFRLLLALGAAALAAMAARAMMDAEALLTAGEAAWSFVALLSLVSILQTALRSGPVDSERICAALSAYLLFGLVCGVVYRLLDQTWPGSFASSAGFEGGALAWQDAVYFSFVTLATLGYGDIVPARPQAQAIAIAEAIAGQFYLVVLVARLVSLYGERPAGGRGR